MSNNWRCDCCGKPISEDVYYKYKAGSTFFSEGRHYCSKRCQNEGESIYKREEKEQEDEEEKLGFFGRLFRTIKKIVIAIVVILIGFYILSRETDSDKKSENTQKTEQVTTKKQSASTTKTTNSSSKTTAGSKPASSKTTTQSSPKTAAIQSPSSQSSSKTGSKAPSTAQTNTTTTSASVATTKSISKESDDSYQTYLALMTLLADEGESLKLCEAQNKTKGKEANVIGKMSQLRGTQYYNDALNDLLGYCPKYASEYSKNGKYFASDADFYQSYISTDYSKILKAKKKGK